MRLDVAKEANLDMHICPGCQRELASGLDSYGQPRLCNLCIVRRVRAQHDASSPPPLRPAISSARLTQAALLLTLLLAGLVWLAMEKFL